jgi:hypothetical protein
MVRGGSRHRIHRVLTAATGPARLAQRDLQELETERADVELDRPVVVVDDHRDESEMRHAGG